MTSTTQGRKIAIIGAAGQLGKPTVETLLAAGVHTITAIQRQESNSSFPEGVIVKKGDLNNEGFLIENLKSQDVLVLMPPLPQIISVQEPAVRAAAKAGVPYVFPSEYGPDPFASKLIEQNGLLQAKKRIRDLIEELGVSSWVSIAVGPWIESGLSAGLWGIDVKAKTATIYKGADGPVNMATISHTGQALGAALGLPEADLAKYKNNAIYTPSLRLTQVELLTAVQRVTMTSDVDWTMQTRDIQEIAEEYEDKINQGDATAPYVKFFATHYVQGSGADFAHKIDQNQLEQLEQLGMGSETIEDGIRLAL